jgi:hypothetical protein
MKRIHRAMFSIHKSSSTLKHNSKNTAVMQRRQYMRAVTIDRENARMFQRLQSIYRDTDKPTRQRFAYQRDWATNLRNRNDDVFDSSKIRRTHARARQHRQEQQQGRAAPQQQRRHHEDGTRRPQSAAAAANGRRRRARVNYDAAVDDDVRDDVATHESGLSEAGEVDEVWSDALSSFKGGVEQQSSSSSSARRHARHPRWERKLDRRIARDGELNRRITLDDDNTSPRSTRPPSSSSSSSSSSMPTSRTSMIEQRRAVVDLPLRVVVRQSNRASATAVLASQWPAANRTAAASMPNKTSTSNTTPLTPQHGKAASSSSAAPSPRKQRAVRRREWEQWMHRCGWQQWRQKKPSSVVSFSSSSLASSSFPSSPARDVVRHRHRRSPLRQQGEQTSQSSTKGGLSTSSPHSSYSYSSSASSSSSSSSSSSLPSSKAPDTLPVRPSLPLPHITLTRDDVPVAATARHKQEVLLWLASSRCRLFGVCGDIDVADDDGRVAAELANGGVAGGTDGSGGDGVRTQIVIDEDDFDFGSHGIVSHGDVDWLFAALPPCRSSDDALSPLSLLRYINSRARRFDCVAAAWAAVCGEAHSRLATADVWWVDARSQFLPNAEPRQPTSSLSSSLSSTVRSSPRSAQRHGPPGRTPWLPAGHNHNNNAAMSPCRGIRNGDGSFRGVDVDGDGGRVSSPREQAVATARRFRRRLEEAYERRIRLERAMHTMLTDVYSPLLLKRTQKGGGMDPDYLLRELPSCDEDADAAAASAAAAVAAAASAQTDTSTPVNGGGDGGGGVTGLSMRGLRLVIDAAVGVDEWTSDAPMALLPLLRTITAIGNEYFELGELAVALAVARRKATSSSPWSVLPLSLALSPAADAVAQERRAEQAWQLNAFISGGTCQLLSRQARHRFLERRNNVDVDFDGGSGETSRRSSGVSSNNSSNSGADENVRTLSDDNAVRLLLDNDNPDGTNAAIDANVDDDYDGDDGDTFYEGDGDDGGGNVWLRHASKHVEAADAHSDAMRANPTLALARDLAFDGRRFDTLSALRGALHTEAAAYRRSVRAAAATRAELARAAVLAALRGERVGVTGGICGVSVGFGGGGSVDDGDHALLRGGDMCTSATLHDADRLLAAVRVRLGTFPRAAPAFVNVDDAAARTPPSRSNATLGSGNGNGAEGDTLSVSGALGGGARRSAPTRRERALDALCRRIAATGFAYAPAAHAATAITGGGKAAAAVAARESTALRSTPSVHALLYYLDALSANDAVFFSVAELAEKVIRLHALVVSRHRRSYHASLENARTQAWQHLRAHSRLLYDGTVVASQRRRALDESATPDDKRVCIWDANTGEQIDNVLEGTSGGDTATGNSDGAAGESDVATLESETPVVDVTFGDVRRLFATCGTGARTLPLLRQLDAAGVRVRSVDDLAAAVRAMDADVTAARGAVAQRQEAALRVRVRSLTPRLGLFGGIKRNGGVGKVSNTVGDGDGDVDGRGGTQGLRHMIAFGDAGLHTTDILYALNSGGACCASWRELAAAVRAHWWASTISRLDELRFAQRERLRTVVAYLSLAEVPLLSAFAAPDPVFINAYETTALSALLLRHSCESQRAAVAVFRRVRRRQFTSVAALITAVDGMDEKTATTRGDDRTGMSSSASSSSSSSSMSSSSSAVAAAAAAENSAERSSSKARAIQSADDVLRRAHYQSLKK